MATASPRRWARIRRRVLQPTPTSIHFQEALRLCRHHQEDQQQPLTSQTDEEMDLSGDMGSVSLNNSNNSSYGTATPTTTTTTPTTTTTSRRTRRNSSSSNNSEQHKTQHTPRRQQQQQQQRLRLPLPDSRTPSPEEEKGGGGGEDSLMEGCESSSRQRTEGGLRLRPCDQTPRGRLMHVSWADHSQQDLVREHPRKRFSRRPSLAEPDPPKSILKAMQ